MARNPVTEGAERAARRPSLWLVWDWLRSRPLPVAVAGVLLIYVDAYLHHYAFPTAPALGNGWWGWADQGRYYEAAWAWAHGNLNPAHHWYLPGYPLIGAVFYWLSPTHPFFIPGAASLAIAMILFVRICETFEIAPRWGALIFILSTVVPPDIF